MLAPVVECDDDEREEWKEQKMAVLLLGCTNKSSTAELALVCYAEAQLRAIRFLFFGFLAFAASSQGCSG